jgi:hypothetical protein
MNTRKSRTVTPALCAVLFTLIGVPVALAAKGQWDMILAAASLLLSAVLFTVRAILAARD